jgi:hypothetical protein
MLRRPFPDATLSALREIGDPKRIKKIKNVKGYFSNVATAGLDVALAKSDVGEIVLGHADSDFKEAIAVLDSYGIEATVAIAQARGLFTKYGDEICSALLLAGLPNTYATAWGARVLVAHGDLVWALPRRVRQTAMFLMTVLTMDEAVDTAADPAGTSTIVRTAAGLRLFHHAVRTQLQRDDDALDALGTENKTPINQEDLLGTLLTFTVTTFGVLDQFGVEWSNDDREAYLLFWDLVGAALGIGTEKVRDDLKKRTNSYIPDPLRPQTVDAATRLLDQLHARQWLPDQDTINNGRPFPWSGLVPGRMLSNALLAALTDAMPAPRRAWPAAVMRELAPTIVRSRLGLNRSGVSTYATRWCADRSRYMKVARAATLRMMANDITSHAMQSFLRAGGPPFEIPGLDLRELTTSRADQSRLADTTPKKVRQASKRRSDPAQRREA